MEIAKKIKPAYLVAGGSFLVLLLGLFLFLNSRRVCKTADNQPAYEVLTRIENEWDDAIKVAQKTSRIALPNQINSLQDIARRVNDTSWSDCSTEAVGHLNESMENEIDGFILFLDRRSSDSEIERKFERAREAQDEYNFAYAKLLPQKEKKKQETRLKMFSAVTQLSIALSDQLLFALKNDGALQTDVSQLTEVEASDDLLNNYSLEVLDSSETLFIYSALAKKRNLNSYILSMTGVDNIICESDAPSKTVPKPTINNGELECAEGSSEYFPD